jgi:REP element-mobilizing transposase RayT
MSFTRLRYHITTATKGRRRLIKPDVEPVLYGAMRDKAESLGAHLFELNGIEDHSHIIAAIPPRLAVSKFVQDVKAYSSKEVNKAFPRLGFKWQTGYAAFTLNAFDMRRAREYVRNQKRHHANNDLIEAYEQIEKIMKDAS